MYILIDMHFLRQYRQPNQNRWFLWSGYIFQTSQKKKRSNFSEQKLYVNLTEKADSNLDDQEFPTLIEMELPLPISQKQFLGGELALLNV